MYLMQFWNIIIYNEVSALYFGAAPLTSSIDIFILYDTNSDWLLFCSTSVSWNVRGISLAVN